MSEAEQRRFMATNVWLYAFTSQDEIKSSAAREQLAASQSKLDGRLTITKPFQSN